MRRPEGDWGLMYRFENEITAADTMLKKKIEQKEASENRAYLDLQLEQKSLEAEAGRVAALADATKQRRDLAVWTLEEEEKRLARKLKAEGVRKEQEALLRSLQETRKADAARIRSQEEEAVQLAKKQLATQKAFDHAKMQKEKERMQQDFAFMEIQIQQKKVEKDEKAASDRQVLLDYQQLLDAQDAARAQVLADMHAKSQGRAALAGGGLVHQQKSKAADEANRLRKEAEEAERLAAEREEATRVKKVAMKEDQQQTLAMQMGLKRDVIAREKAAVEKLAEAAMRKEELAAAKEAAAEFAKRERNVQYKKDLIVQMHQDRDKELPEETMNLAEAQMNAPLMTRAREILQP